MAKLIPHGGPPASIAWSSSWSFLGEVSPHCLMWFGNVHLRDSFSKPIAHMWVSAEPVGQTVGLGSDAGQRAKH